MFFVVKKILSAAFLPPGIFIIILGYVAYRNYKLRKKTLGHICLAIMAALYLISIRPVNYLLMEELEKAQPFPSDLQGDVVLLFGGGAISDVPDIKGIGNLGGDSANRLLMALRLQKMNNAYLFISSGPGLSGDPVECTVGMRYALQLGIPRDKVILDEKARDTNENAINSLILCKEKGFKKALLVTSAYHMSRSWKIMQEERKTIYPQLEVIPVPCNYYLPQRDYVFAWDDLLPRIGFWRDFGVSVHEYAGLLALSVGLK